MFKAASTAPPPGTTEPLSNVRLMIERVSCIDLSISSNILSFAPRKMIDDELTTLVPLTRINSSSEIRSWTTSSAVPSNVGSNVSSPSKLAKDATRVAPVALAIRRRSSFLHRRTAIAPASMNSLRHKSSIPFVVRMTFAPAAKIFLMRSNVISDSLW